ncbi:hypothetical protein [Schlesneria sp. DSM 10557]|uniref:hypothetical protein n=1 Tax=Schlesneria sp. DSM 10557 TaxID=3044399 RepID=UPI0035C7B623
MRFAASLTLSWQRQYSEVRPHSSRGYQTPAEFTRTCGPSATAPEKTPAPSLQALTFNRIQN